MSMTMLGCSQLRGWWGGSQPLLLRPQLPHKQETGRQAPDACGTLLTSADISLTSDPLSLPLSFFLRFIRSHIPPHLHMKPELHLKLSQICSGRGADGTLGLKCPISPSLGRSRGRERAVKRWSRRLVGSHGGTLGRTQSVSGSSARVWLFWTGVVRRVSLVSGSGRGGRGGI